MRPSHALTRLVAAGSLAGRASRRASCAVCPPSSWICRRRRGRRAPRVRAVARDLRTPPAENPAHQRRRLEVGRHPGAAGGAAGRRPRPHPCRAGREPERLVGRAHLPRRDGCPGRGGPGPVQRRRQPGDRRARRPDGHPRHRPARPGGLRDQQRRQHRPVHHHLRHRRRHHRRACSSWSPGFPAIAISTDLPLGTDEALPGNKEHFARVADFLVRLVGTAWPRTPAGPARASAAASPSTSTTRRCRRARSRASPCSTIRAPPTPSSSVTRSSTPAAPYPTTFALAPTPVTGAEATATSDVSAFRAGYVTVVPIDGDYTAPNPAGQQELPSADSRASSPSRHAPSTHG